MREISRLSGNNFECFPLTWDTEYFGIESGRTILKGIVTDKEQDKIIQYCKQFEFVTISNIGNVKENNQWIGKKTNAFLTDMNIQFSKRLIEESNCGDRLTSVYNAYPKDRNVINIAKSAFQFSRFFNDPALPENQARNIYLHWTECAFGQADKYFVITKRNNEVAGYILFSTNSKESSATIELIAVDNKYQGQKVGKSLISEFESYTYKNGFNKIKVGTQVDNSIAIQFYTACGFKYEGCSSIYHYWMRKR